ncbi:MAG TPA: DUF480 domain-containing protein [Casimicrobiaceae bacterium]|nr:DUF480 domain-containing protein [Casimicrobiaceae bacterium]
MTSSLLSPSEGRVLGVLIEKQRTVPDAYPLTLNALVAGCNQKSSREPVMTLSENHVQQALDGLRDRALVIETSGGRVMRHAHNAERALGLPSQSVALLAVLLLRGPQTVGELRINCDRMHRFADTSAVEAFLHELAERAAGALVAELPRTPGTRETRWIQLLTPAPETAVPRAIPAMEREDGSPPPEVASLREEVASLREEVASLREEVAALREARSG